MGIRVQYRRDEMVNKMKRMSNVTNTVIEKSCHRIRIGKTFWKGIVLPNAMYGAEAVNIREVDIQKLQKAENSALRRILKAPRSTALTAVRREIGIGNMKSRLVRGILQYVRRAKQGSNRLLRGVMSEAGAGQRSGWWQTTDKYLKWAEMQEDELEYITKEQMKSRIAQKVEREWRAEMEMKSSLWLYRSCKGEMREESYGGDEESTIWFRARENCLQLGKMAEKTRNLCYLCAMQKRKINQSINQSSAI